MGTFWVAGINPITIPGGGRFALPVVIYYLKIQRHNIILHETIVVQVIGHRSDLGRTKNGENVSKSQLGWDFRVVPTNIININAYMLILINKLTEISKIPDFPENSGYFVPEPMGSPSEWSEP